MENNDKKEEGEAKPTEDAGEGDKPEAVDPIAEAKAILDATRAENDRREKLLQEEKELKAIKIIGGDSPAGSAPVEKKEETPKEYKDRIMKGE